MRSVSTNSRRFLENSSFVGFNPMELIRKKRYSVLCFIFGSYERVHEIGEKDPDAEYILVTDIPDLKSETWTVIRDVDLDDRYTVWEKCMRVRYNPFKYCCTDICIRIDGSIHVKKPLKVLIDEFERRKADICLMPHPYRHSFIDEYGAWIAQRGYTMVQAKRCLSNFKWDGYDINYKGLFQTGFSIVRNNEITDRIHEMTFEYLKKCECPGKAERIDQIVFSFIMNQYFSDLNVLPVSEQVIKSAYMTLCQHNSDIPIPFNKDIHKSDIHYMFNKETECLYLV